ncbi:MAG TPA: GNAT family N-acetyltransferase [Candidatus Hydrogenedens sp.]|nr:GNAT family N-acetyltransferase [Candidatus Hydrogenedens sp.]
MIEKLHAIIRTADRFDVKQLFHFYMQEPIHASLLDAKREPLMPNISELEELLLSKDAAQSFYTVENKQGDIQGFVILKGVNPEVMFAEIILLFNNDIYEENKLLVEEALEFIETKAFQQLHLRKIITTCLDDEKNLHTFLSQHSYQCEGVMREVLFTTGKWHNLETWAKFNF